MDTMEYSECISHIDPVEMLMRAEKPRKFAAEGNTEDAIACAMAEGFRMGWEAYKKYIEKKESSI